MVTTSIIILTCAGFCRWALVDQFKAQTRGSYPYCAVAKEIPDCFLTPMARESGLPGLGRDGTES